MTTATPPTAASAGSPVVHLRSYGPPGAPDRHDFAQLVLPLRGALALEIEGRTGRLDPLRGGVVAPGAWHAQDSAGDNRNLIVDLDIDAAATPDVAARLLERPFPQIDPAARKLVEFMGILAGEARPAPAVLAGWLPLLLDRLASLPPRPGSHLAALMAQIELEPGLPWRTETMARRAGLSVSRLHALFRDEFDATPHGWLLALRLARVREWLAHGDAPIAELALRAGFCDQSALTRALRDATGMSPAVYRREQRDERQRERRSVQQQTVQEGAQENSPKRR
jgi:AraC-like DNA-binding protein